jgi:hypothetical protein
MRRRAAAGSIFPAPPPAPLAASLGSTLRPGRGGAGESSSSKQADSLRVSEERFVLVVRVVRTLLTALQVS